MQATLVAGMDFGIFSRANALPACNWSSGPASMFPLDAKAGPN